MITPREGTPPAAMTPDRWRRVKAVVQAALERNAAARAEFLALACTGDDALRREAESLLASYDAASDFLEVPAVVAAGLDGEAAGREADAPDELPARLAAALQGRYVLVRELGGGGMARVFLAEEPALGRPVVVKVLRPDLAAALSAERFAREVRFAARLQQANIVPVLSAGDADGLPFYTMPWVRGESLRARMTTGVSFTPATALGVLHDVARALAYAHAEGVVHRDVKPENVLLSGGTACVTDFGIAKALSAAGAAGAGDGGRVPRADDPSTLTSAGISLGTPAYMAPEQVAGEPHVDARVDVYAFGVLAYELLAGAHPFAERRTRAELLVAQLAELPADLGRRCPGLPPRLAALVMRCLAKAAEARFPDGAALLAALEAVDVPSAPVDGPTYAVAAPSGGHGTPEARGWSSDAPSLAVLPFANLSADLDNEYFSDGITDEVLNALTRMRGLRVAARSSSFAFKGERVDLRTVAERLGVSAVLEGSVRRVGSRVRIAVQLVSATDGLALWSERYDRELADIFAMQDEIAGAIAQALERRLTDAAAEPITSTRQEPRGAVDPEAFELYLRGRHLLEQRADGMVEALGCFEQAIARAPGFSAPYAGMGLAFAMFGIYQALRPHEAFPRARDAADRALALDRADALATVVRAHVALWYEWDPERALTLARRALELAPGFYLAHDGFGFALAALGRFDAAIDAMQRARALDPLSDFATYDLGWILILAGRWDDAVRELRPAVERHPRSSELRRVLGFALLHAGRREEALEELRAMVTLNPAGRWGPANLAQGLAATGQDAEARALVRQMEDRMAHEPLPAVGLAIAHHWLGDDDAASAWLERSIEARDFWLVMLRHDPSVARLRGEPRFERLLARVRPLSEGHA